MSQTPTHVLEAGPADLAEDMGHHRQTYHRFLKLMRWASIGSALVLILVFFVVY
ncbi:MAG: aa3-type cytochrome c oxidase subunit IV [Bauldia sp.]|jgi:hypothetical protein